MRVPAPTFALEPDRVVVTATFESDALPDGAARIRLAAPRSLLGRIIRRSNLALCLPGA